MLVMKKHALLSATLLAVSCAVIAQVNVIKEIPNKNAQAKGTQTVSTQQVKNTSGANLQIEFPERCEHGDQ